MSLAKILLATLIVTFAPSFAAADPRQFGNTVYTPLPGWTEGRNDKGELVILSDLPDDLCEYCYIHLTASTPGRGDVAMYLSREKLRFVDEDDKESATAVGTPTVLSLAGHKAAMQGIKVGGNIQIVIAVTLGDRFELFGFQGSADDNDKLAESMSVFQDQVVPFFEKMTFVSAGATPVLPRAQPGGIDGIWWGWSTSTSLGVDMMMRQDMNFRTLIFWPDGYFYDGAPAEGLAAIDPDALQARADPNYGVYVKSGDTLTLTFATGEVETLTAKGADWEDSQKTLSQVQPLADGTPLVGAVSSFFYSGFTPGSGVEGGVSSSSSTEFFANGTYKGESFGGAFGNFDGGGGFSTGKDGATGGSYVVQGGMVISTPADGEPQSAALALQVDDENILIGDKFLEVSK